MSLEERGLGRDLPPLSWIFLILRYLVRTAPRFPRVTVERSSGPLILLLLLLPLLAGCSDPPRAEPSRGDTALVTRHTDGDTLWLSGVGKVRLIGIDTPEVYGGVECYGREASAFVERLLPLGSRVRYVLGVEERDRYGRALAYVHLDDGRFLNLMLVRRGYAQPLTVPPNVEFAERFAAAARRARASRSGLWGEGVCR
jgi:micrococcal nuclease